MSGFPLGFVADYPLALGYSRGSTRAPTSSATRHQAPGYQAKTSSRDKQIDTVEHLQLDADRRGLSLVNLAIGTLLARLKVSAVTAGATRPEQMVATALARKWHRSKDDLIAQDATVYNHIS